jgi:hypothetical protein
MPEVKPPKKKAVKKTAKKAVKKSVKSDYDRYKFFHGKEYTGMKVGRSHKWNYDAGVWKETKITPDLWEISYAVTKRRAGHAPEGSGVPVGTGYHWYIFSHQIVKKLNANDYSTEMTGLKYKLAHKRFDKEKWSASAKTQRKHLIEFLKKMVKQLEHEPVPIQFEYNGEEYKGEGVPVLETCMDGVCYELDITLNDRQLGIIKKMKSGWKMDLVKDKKFIDAIGENIMLWYE